MQRAVAHSHAIFFALCTSEGCAAAFIAPKETEVIDWCCGAFPCDVLQVLSSEPPGPLFPVPCTGTHLPRQHPREGRWSLMAWQPLRLHGLAQAGLGVLLERAGTELLDVALACMGLRLATACSCLNGCKDPSALRLLESNGCEIVLWQHDDLLTSDACVVANVAIRN